ncbi:MAG: sigma factor-like helix-turn-helix DNA-binding protein [Clostridia bacterium]
MIDIEEINDNVKVQDLFEIYSSMLTAKQRDVMDLYYFSDLSLREIAQNKKITYQAVRDSIKTAEKLLNDCESKLLINKKNKKIEKAIAVLAKEESAAVKKAVKILESL